jgi:plastocyanin
MKKWLAMPVLAVSLVAAGCGGGGGGGGGTSSTPAPASTSKTSGGGVLKVSMKNIQFNPGSVTVKKGGTVEWTNDDSVNHDVTKESGPGPNFVSGTGNIGPGGTYKQTFDTPGTISYRCTVHPGMTGKVVVQ